MTNDELKDRAYLIATSNNMLEYYTLAEFEALEKIPTGADAWEPYEHWTEEMISEHVIQIAEDIIYRFKEFVTELD